MCLKSHTITCVRIAIWIYENFYIIIHELYKLILRNKNKLIKLIHYLYYRHFIFLSDLIKYIIYSCENSLFLNYQKLDFRERKRNSKFSQYFDII